MPTLIQTGFCLDLTASGTTSSMLNFIYVANSLKRNQLFVYSTTAYDVK